MRVGGAISTTPQKSGQSPVNDYMLDLRTGASTAMGSPSKVTVANKNAKPYCVVFEVTQRTINADGQKLLAPETEVSTWWTSLKLSAKEVIALHHVHGRSEQYHSEIKTDADLERLPSGKFATNATMLSLGLMAYNVLRLCGRAGEAVILPVSAGQLSGVNQGLLRLQKLIDQRATINPSPVAPGSRLVRRSSFWSSHLFKAPWGSSHEPKYRLTPRTFLAHRPDAWA